MAARGRAPAISKERPLESPDSRLAARELLSFKVAEQEFCVDIAGVREIRGWTPATPVPHAPAFMRGVINLRGAVMPVIDLGARLGLATSAPTARHVIIVARVGQQQIGLVVDAVCETFAVAPDAVQRVDLGLQALSSMIEGFLQVEGRMVSLITLDALLEEPLAEGAAAA
jgi:purine-binding chemotaxis protein CheW